jgi:hypothetical protein
MLNCRFELSMNLQSTGGLYRPLLLNMRKWGERHLERRNKAA